MLGVCFVVLLAAFDQALVGVALPRIVADLQGFALYSWVGTAFFLTSAIALPITGRLGDLFGRKPFVLSAIVLFVLASLACAMANSMLMLVIARALQGLGGGMLVGTTFASVADIFPDQQRRIRWQAMMASAFAIANLSGPSLGGFMTEEYGWRSTFYVNLPIGFVAFIMVLIFLPRVAGSRKPGVRVDWSGALLLGVLISTGLIAIQEGAARGGDGLLSLRFAALLTVVLLMGWLFIQLQLRVAQPILPLHLFKVRAVRLLALVSLCGGSSLFVLIFFTPLLLQAGFDVSPNTSGFLITPLVGGIAIGSLINGRLFTRVHKPHLLLSYGLGCFALCWLAIILLRPGMSHSLIMSVFGVTGLSLGFLFPNLVIQMQAAVARQDVGMASALVQSSRMLGNMAGVAIAGVLVINGYHASLDDVLTRQGQPAQVLQNFADPQVLVNPQLQAELRQQAEERGPEAAAALETTISEARDSLIDGVHAAYWLAWVLAVMSFLLARRVPPMRT